MVDPPGDVNMSLSLLKEGEPVTDVLPTEVASLAQGCGRGVPHRMLGNAGQAERARRLRLALCRLKPKEAWCFTLRHLLKARRSCSRQRTVVRRP
jgi:hypothetical protein